MPESPPKRMTRARAAKVAAESINKAAIPDTTALSKLAEKATCVTKRKARADEDDEAPAAKDGALRSKKKTVAVKAARPRSAKAAVKEDAPAPAPEEAVLAKKEKGARKEAAPKTRGRPPKADKALVEPIVPEAVEEQLAPTRKATRSRAAAAPIKPVLVRKKVTFLDPNDDQENRVPSPEELKSFKKPESSKAEKLTGLKAKPKRKPALPTRASSRGKKADAAAGENEPQRKTGAPLSPKKVKQIAVNKASLEEEDELAVVETVPMRILARSPIKTPKRDFKDLTRPFAFAEAEAADGAKDQPESPTALSPSRAPTTALSSMAVRSPQKASSSSMIASPARRVPSSPFKEALKEPPLKFNLGATSSMTPSQPLAMPASAFRASFLQSPARRPAASPVKPLEFISPRKFKLAGSGFDIGTPLRAPILTDERASSVLNIAKTPISEVAMAVDSAMPDASEISVIPDSEALKLSEATTPTMNSLERELSEIDVMMTETSLRIASRELFDSSKEDEQMEIEKEIVNNEAGMGTLNVEEAASKPQSQAEVETTGTVLDAPVETPCGVSPPTITLPKSPQSFEFSTPGTQYDFGDSDSEDELQSAAPKFSSKSPRSQRIFAHDINALTPSVLPHAGSAVPNGFGKSQNIDFTPLAEKFGSWAGASPDKKIVQYRQERQHGLFSPALPKQADPYNPYEGLSAVFKSSLAKGPFFDDDTLDRIANDGDMLIDYVEENHNIMHTEPAETSDCSDDYGDENMVPIDPMLLAEDVAVDIETASIAFCTPVRDLARGPRVFHTVSKIPLKPAAEDSPSRPVKRRNSLSNSLPPSKFLQAQSLARAGAEAFASMEMRVPEQRISAASVDPFTTPVKSAGTGPVTPGTAMWSSIGTPARTPRRDLNPQTLKGAVIYVDVHTTEGADASGIFIELLTQMGARCVKQWTWNPNASVSSPSSSGGDGSPNTIHTSKIGITHVVFKDGGKRTLEKVTESKGVVLCVGVAWVLDCERENRWVDEASYAVDTSAVPRGGRRRRKSMEPRRLVSPSKRRASSAPTFSKAASAASPTKEFLTLTSPPSRRSSTQFVPVTIIPGTPVAEGLSEEYSYEEPSPDSPCTPYFLHPAALVPKTCPPKKIQPLMFPTSGRIEDHPDEGVRMRLLMARRKSLQWMPKVRSPLGQDMSGQA
ncbi:MAG: hypothetical protein M1829_003637 [Trizodia sp. TS-e1964]|nr:MAG: hypothetical protein M1829_003637 [Trizodia sp. TS-e1964]